MIKNFVLFFLLLFSQFTQAQPASTDIWHGFSRTRFSYQNHPAWLVKPRQALPGNPWIWKAYFPDWHPEIDSILLQRGFHLAYLEVNDQFGSPKAMQIWDGFYNFITSNYQLSSKVALEGISRGGLYVYAWAKRNPLLVSCIYAEAPVLDAKSWPGGKGQGKGSPDDWQKYKDAFRLTDEQAIAFKDNPIDNLQGMAAVKVPVLHSVGLEDKVVPFAENTSVLFDRYIKLGGIATVYPMTRYKQALEGHHYVIEHPERIADFIQSNSMPAQALLNPSTFHTQRSSFQNSYLKFTREKKGRVVFMGGSITEGGGWRDKVCQYLQERFPETVFEFINAGISSTGSTPGAFRLQTEVLEKGMVDLFFEEAAVNDRTNFFSPQAQVRGMEGIIRSCLLSNPLMDIVQMHFVEPDKIKDYHQSIVPVEIVQHEKVAAHYKTSSLNLAAEVTQRIDRGEFTWNEDFKDLHPSAYGHEVYFRSMKQFFNKAYDLDTLTNLTYTPHVLPAAPLDKYSYVGVTYLPVSNAKQLKGFSLIQDWIPTGKVGGRKQYVHRPVLEAVTPGSVLTLDFKGSCIGICVNSGPDAGMIEYSVDGAPFKKMDLYTKWSGILHLPWYLMLEEELKDKKHQLLLRVLGEKNEKSEGNAVRVVWFLGR